MSPAVLLAAFAPAVAAISLSSFWTCEILCTTNRDCMASPKTSCVSEDSAVGTCKNLYYAGGKGNDVCYGPSCKTQNEIFCEVATSKIYLTLPSERQEEEACYCMTNKTNRLCIDRSDNVCKVVCDRTIGCKQSFCMTWENPPRCHNLYWVSDQQTCYEHLNCPKDHPVLCGGSTTTVVSFSSPEIIDQGKNARNIKRSHPHAEPYSVANEREQAEDIRLEGRTMCGTHPPATAAIRFGQETAEIFFSIKGTQLNFPDQRYYISDGLLTLVFTSSVKDTAAELNKEAPDSLSAPLTEKGFDFEFGGLKIEMRAITCSDSFYRTNNIPRPSL